jgi:hypothetical protein
MICLTVLIAVQFYGSYVLWIVAVGISKKADNTRRSRGRNGSREEEELEDIESGDGDGVGGDHDHEKDLQLDKAKKAREYTIALEAVEQLVFHKGDVDTSGSFEEDLEKERETA